MADMNRSWRELNEAFAGAERGAGDQASVLQSILDSIGHGVVVADENGEFTVFNPAAERILGIGAVQSGPDSWAEQYGVYLPDQTTPCPPQDVPLVRALRGETVDQVELFVRHARLPEGAFISVTGKPLKDAHGRLRGGVVVFQDISERKRAEESLRQSEQRFRRLVEGVQDYAIFSLDRNGYVTSWNAGAERIKGYTADEIIGKHFACFYEPHAVAKGWTDHELRVAATEGRFEDEGWRIRKDGTRFWASVVITALRDETGTLFGFSKITRDLTERKRIEEQVRTMNEELERRVGQRTAELAEANRQLVQKNQENEMFVYTVSHDLRSPLVNLQGFSKELDLIRQELGDLLLDRGLPLELRDRAFNLLNHDMAESIRFIRSGVTRLSGIIDALLRLSRAGRVEYQWRSVDVEGTVQRIIDSLHGTIVDRSAKVIFGHLPPAWGDPAAVEQVFSNLIGNALNYLDPRRQGLIEIGTLRTDDAGPPPPDATAVTYYVNDNGLGISPLHASKIFQPFQRLHPQASRGEGIGLATVRRVVERHGGKIWFESAEGIGSTFLFTLSPVPTVSACETPQRNGFSSDPKDGTDVHAAACASPG